MAALRALGSCDCSKDLYNGLRPGSKTRSGQFAVLLRGISGMPKDCPTCSGKRVLLRRTTRTWWQVLLFRPKYSETRCDSCRGIGLVRSEEERRERDRRQSPQARPPEPLPSKGIAAITEAIRVSRHD